MPIVSPVEKVRTIRRAGLLAVSAVASGCMLATPSRAHVGAPPADLDAVSVAFASGSGSIIHAWYARGSAHGGAVLLLHGVGANRTQMLGRARFLHSLGFTVLAPDFQAHGESSGDHITFGARESLDAAAALDFLHHTVPDERVGVIGVSMGGAAALLGPGPLAANAFVLESVYPTIRQALGDRLDTWLGPLGGVARLFTPMVLNIVGNDIGVTETELQPIDRIARLNAPLLLISGTQDPYTPIVEAESLFAHARGPKTYWAVDGAGHEDLHAYDPDQYELRVGEFLQATLRVTAGDSASRR